MKSQEKVRFDEEMDLLWRAVGICIASKGGYANPYLLSKQFATKGSEPSPLQSQFFGVGGMDYFEEEMDF